MKAQTVAMPAGEFYTMLGAALGRSPRSIRRSLNALLKTGMIKRLEINGETAFEFSNEWVEKIEGETIEKYGELPPLGSDYADWIAKRGAGHAKK